MNVDIGWQNWRKRFHLFILLLGAVGYYKWLKIPLYQTVGYFKQWCSTCSVFSIELLSFVTIYQHQQDQNIVYIIICDDYSDLFTQQTETREEIRFTHFICSGDMLVKNTLVLFLSMFFLTHFNMLFIATRYASSVVSSSMSCFSSSNDLFLWKYKQPIMT